MPRRSKIVEIIGPNVPDEVIDLGEAGVLYRFYAPPQPPYQRQPTDPLWWAAGYPPHDHDRKVGKDYSSASYIMKRMWQLSRSDAVATIYAVSRYAIRGSEGIKLDQSVTVFASPAIYDHMVQAMRAYQERDMGDFFSKEPCIAVLAQWEATNDCCEVLWANGTSYTANPPKIRFHPAPAHQGGAYPMNDPTFIPRLGALLDDLTPRYQPRRIAKKPARITRQR